MTRRALFVVALALGASAGAARVVGAQQVAYAAGAASLDSVTQAALRREMSRAQERGLPVEPLEAKVREGQIKRAAPARIRSAVTALATRLDSARSALGPMSNAAELVAGADALAAGADVGALRTLRATGGARDLAAPLGALAQLVASGVAPSRATQMVVELLKRGVAPREVLAFGVAVESDVGAGVPAEESAVFRLRAIESAVNGGVSASAVSGAYTDPGMLNLGGKSGTGDAAKPKRRP
ncbi:MAG TPA: hypothetical protein VF461_11560 [Gemmatimonadaceae bacterium]